MVLKGYFDLWGGTHQNDSGSKLDLDPCSGSTQKINGFSLLARHRRDFFAHRKQNFMHLNIFDFLRLSSFSDFPQSIFLS